MRRKLIGAYRSLGWSYCWRRMSHFLIVYDETDLVDTACGARPESLTLLTLADTYSATSATMSMRCLNCAHSYVVMAYSAAGETASRRGCVCCKSPKVCRCNVKDMSTPTHDAWLCIVHNRTLGVEEH